MSCATKRKFCIESFEHSSLTNVLRGREQNRKPFCFETWSSRLLVFRRGFSENSERASPRPAQGSTDTAQDITAPGQVALKLLVNPRVARTGVRTAGPAAAPKPRCGACCGQQQLSSCWSDLIGGPGLVPIAVRCSQDFGPPPSNVAPRQSAPCSPSSSKKLPEETVATHVANADALWQLFATTRTFQHIFSNRNTQRFGGPSLRSRGGL